MKFLVCMKQVGYGCDYTIGCGMVYEVYDGETIEDVVEQVIWPDGKGEYCLLQGDQALENILIVPMEYVKEIDIKGYLSQVEAEQKAQKLKSLELKELSELKRLQEKYNH